MKADLVIENVTLATMVGGAYGLIRDAALAVGDGVIVWAGSREAVAPHPGAEVLDGGGGLLTPGLIDCHTHLVYGGNRADEFEMRLRGVSYEEIAREGGGIMSTVRATRNASVADLVAAARPRVQSLLREGVTTLEVKTGYGLDLETELKMLEVMEQLQQDFPGVEIVRTFLGAHIVPPAYRERPDVYVDLICEEMLPDVAERVDAVDVFCESIAFTPAQTARIFQCARAHQLPVKIHAEQLSNLGAAALAAGIGALSADHLEHLDEAGARAMAEHGTTAVLLPGALYFLREKRRPPVDLLRQYDVPIAIATDANPGTSPCFSILAAMSLSCVLLGLTPEEALAGVTVHAARALGRADRVGSLETGKQADMVLWDVSTPSELAYYLGYNPCRAVFKRGVPVAPLKPWRRFLGARP